MNKLIANTCYLVLTSLIVTFSFPSFGQINEEDQLDHYLGVNATDKGRPQLNVAVNTQYTNLWASRYNVGGNVLYNLRHEGYLNYAWGDRTPSLFESFFLDEETNYEISSFNRIEIGYAYYFKILENRVPFAGISFQAYYRSQSTEYAQTFSFIGQIPATGNQTVEYNVLGIGGGYSLPIFFDALNGRMTLKTSAHLEYYSRTDSSAPLSNEQAIIPFIKGSLTFRII